LAFAGGVGSITLGMHCGPSPDYPPYVQSFPNNGKSVKQVPEAGTASDAASDGGLDPTALLTSLSPSQLQALCDAIWGTSYGMTLSVTCDGGAQSVTAPVTQATCVTGLTFTNCAGRVSDALGCYGPAGACAGSMSPSCLDLNGCQ